MTKDIGVEQDKRVFARIADIKKPAKREWVWLTAQEAAECWTTNATQTWKNFEAKLKEKNT